MTNLYSSPIFAPGTSTDQYPLPSLANGCAALLHWLKVPAANTSVANGAQTRNATPPGKRMVPIPGRVDGDTVGEATDVFAVMENTSRNQRSLRHDRIPVYFLSPYKQQLVRVAPFPRPVPMVGPLRNPAQILSRAAAPPAAPFLAPPARRIKAEGRAGSDSFAAVASPARLRSAWHSDRTCLRSFRMR